VLGRQLYLYDEGTARTLDASQLAAYVSEKTGLRPVIRGSFLSHFAPSPEAQQALAAQIAGLKVRDMNRPFSPAQAGFAEVEFERRRLAAEDRGPFGLLYDGFLFQALLRGLLPKEEAGLQHLHIVFTNRTLGAYDEGDLRYHLRTILLASPAVISTSGLVEAPAKPRDFYAAQQAIGAAARVELTYSLLKEQFKGRFLDHDDPRLTEVAKGFVMQAIVYHWTGEAFCGERDCRLFNAHWQEDLLHSQLHSPRDLCPRHEAAVARLKRSA
jgi:hypothetical protein